MQYTVYSTNWEIKLNAWLEQTKRKPVENEDQKYTCFMLNQNKTTRNQKHAQLAEREKKPYIPCKDFAIIHNSVEKIMRKRPISNLYSFIFKEEKTFSMHCENVNKFKSQLNFKCQRTKFLTNV